MPNGTQDLRVTANAFAFTIIYSTPNEGVKFQIQSFFKDQWGGDWFNRDSRSAWFPDSHTFFGVADLGDRTVVIKGKGGKASIISITTSNNGNLDVKRHQEFNFEGGNPDSASCVGNSNSKMTCVFSQGAASKTVEYEFNTGAFNGEDNPVSSQKAK